MLIRPARFEDIPMLRAFFRALVLEQGNAHAPLYPVIDAEEVDHFTLGIAKRVDDPDCYGFVAEVDGTLVGMLLGDIQHRAVGKPHHYSSAHWLYVMPGHRGQGIGRALTRAGLQWGQERGVTHAELAMVTGDTQWLGRGWTPYVTRCFAPIEALWEAAAAERLPPPKKRGRKPKASGTGATHAAV